MTTGKTSRDKFDGIEENTGPGDTHAPVDTKGAKQGKTPSQTGEEEPSRNSGSGSSANAPRGDVPPITDPKNPALHPSGTPGAPTRTFSDEGTSTREDDEAVSDVRDVIKEGDYGD